MPSAWLLAGSWPERVSTRREPRFAESVKTNSVGAQHRVRFIPSQERTHNSGAPCLHMSTPKTVFLSVGLFTVGLGLRQHCLAQKAHSVLMPFMLKILRKPLTENGLNEATGTPKPCNVPCEGGLCTDIFDGNWRHTLLCDHATAIVSIPR